MGFSPPVSSLPSAARLRQICRRLKRALGPIPEWERLPPLDELIATILSQSTSDTNSGRAFDELRRRFRNWDDVRRAPVAKIAATIRQAGLANQKAPRIKALLQQLHAERGALSLDYLQDLPMEAAFAELRRFKGVGPKTAACVLLFACNMPVLPVDTHVHRLSRRLALIGERTTAEAAHDVLAKAVPAELVLEFHLQLIRHGRQVCHARNPCCQECVLLDLCPTGRGD